MECSHYKYHNKNAPCIHIVCTCPLFTLHKPAMCCFLSSAHKSLGEKHLDFRIAMPVYKSLSTNAESFPSQSQMLDKDRGVAVKALGKCSSEPFRRSEAH